MRQIPAQYPGTAPDDPRLAAFAPSGNIVLAAGPVLRVRMLPGSAPFWKGARVTVASPDLSEISAERTIVELGQDGDLATVTLDEAPEFALGVLLGCEYPA